MVVVYNWHTVLIYTRYLLDKHSSEGTGNVDPAAAGPIINDETDYRNINLFMFILKLYLLLHELTCLLGLHNLQYDPS